MSPVQREVRACAAIVRFAWLTRANQGSMALTWVLAGAAVLFPLLGGFISGKWGKSVGFGALLPFCLLALLWWVFLSMSVEAQNKGRLSPLTPALARRSLTVLVVSAVLIASTVTWLAWLAGLPLLTALSACALVLTFTVGFTRLPKPALFLVQGVALLPVLGLGKYLAFLNMVDSHTLGLAGGAVALLVGALGFPRLVRRGVAPDVLALTGQAVAAPHVRSWFPRSLRRAIAARKPGPLLLHALGPKAHAGFLAMPLVGGLAVGAVVGLLLGVPFSSFWMRAGVVAGLLMTQALAAAMLATAMYGKVREQALVRLSAGAPRASGFNRVFGPVLLRQFGLWWVISTALAMLVAPLLGGSAADMPRVLAAACLGLVGGALILRPYAAPRTRGTLVALVRVVWILLSALAGFGAVRDDFGAAAWAAFAAAVLLCAAVLLWLRWRAFSAAPAVFPAGRLA